MSTMHASEVTPMERVTTTLQHRESDRVPFVLALGMYASHELGMTVPEFYADPANVIEGSLRTFAKYGSDVIAGTWPVAIELEAWGTEILWFDDGPPNAGGPIINHPEDILRLVPPRFEDGQRARWMLECISAIRARVGPDVPIMGGIVGPNSLPVMQMGFEAYLNLILERRDLWARLMAVNEEWSVAWGNAQLAAGATALAYFDPLASSTIVPPALYRETGFEVARRVIPRLNGGTVTVLASGRALPVIPDLIETGTLGVAPSVLDDLEQVVEACRGRATIVGNLNGIEMRHWTQQEAEAKVRDLIRTAAPGGGLIVADNHGEIPLQVPEDILLAISEAVRVHGRYPIAGIDG
ncbi:MAG: uroporphyrinogen decarboxylase family protein [Chloroflexota bacterium]